MLRGDWKWLWAQEEGDLPPASLLPVVFSALGSHKDGSCPALVSLSFSGDVHDVSGDKSPCPPGFVCVSLYAMSVVKSGRIYCKIYCR